jgi:hypothetical protein
MKEEIMAKKGEGNWWEPLLWIGGCALFLLVVKVATDEEKSGKPVPADPGGRIDLIVEKLNARFGKGWVTVGLNALRAYLEQTLPKDVVTLVNVVYGVEQLSGNGFWPMTGPDKRQAAVQGALSS